MKHVFWLIPERLAGRAGLTSEARSLSELRAGGIDAVRNKPAPCTIPRIARRDVERHPQTFRGFQRGRPIFFARLARSVSWYLSLET